MTSAVLVALAVLGCGDKDPSSNDESSSGSPGSSTGGVDSSSTGDPAGTTTGSSSEGGTTADASESSTADSSSGETGEIVLHGACELADRVGGFALLREDIYTTFSGSVADGVVPVSVLENVGEDGDCRLLRRNNPFCDPSCGPGETCDFDGNCIAYPTNHDVGIVDVTGLLEPVSVEPIMPTFEYFDTQLPHPAWDEAAVIQLSAAGGDFDAFELVGVGVAMIEPAGDDLVLDASAAMTVEWVPAEAGLAKVRVEISIDQHGSTPSKLVCESDDTGMLTVSQELIAEFVALGVTGFPAANFYRETVDSVDLAPGCVEFGVRSHVQTDLTVAGHTPCTGDEDCPKPQICDVPNETCIDP